ncbi:MAG: ankyrin repeat domain-containing protein [Candidatus Schekmanbacteria bacterium]|nr:ankyrin repeat domain-containing protein [Candidatus Schekmanbacteria bacterium]
MEEQVQPGVVQTITDFLSSLHPAVVAAVVAVIVAYVVLSRRRAARGPETELMKAARRGDLSRLKELIKAGTDINAIRHGPPLVVAAEAGQASIVRELLMAGAKPNVRDLQGRTALAVARKRRDADCIRALERAGGQE